MYKNNIPIILAFIIIFIVVLIPRFSNDNIDFIINSFDRCVDAGNSVVESNPKQCESGGIIFIENE